MHIFDIKKAKSLYLYGISLYPVTICFTMK